ncbi:hypothetical protein [endosymbiont GvMRE of Glomus versiforme]|uniref:hypothetical protein n=1 Tax=endosymbiont GvMRE of Glomus versiforme TaxID=2039283 RepID=UPI000ED9320D|nr:hypothetical protein [endosymbiont GvMRE of Glomus versiforme]RHZ36236.1 hypothetical protein GvMRE_Ic1g158 [endosymbiont GvMRE of Glomus versiforme]
MTKNNKDLKIIDKKFTAPPVPKTETRIVLEQQDLYPDLDYEDINSHKGYGPCLESNCSHTPSQLRTQARELERQARELDQKARQKKNARQNSFYLRLSLEGDYWFYARYSGSSVGGEVSCWTKKGSEWYAKLCVCAMLMKQEVHLLLWILLK